VFEGKSQIKAFFQAICVCFFLRMRKSSIRKSIFCMQKNERVFAHAQKRAGKEVVVNGHAIHCVPVKRWPGVGAASPDRSIWSA